MDNYFTSLPLLNKLRGKRLLGAPISKKVGFQKKVRRSYDQTCDVRDIVIVWHDNKTINIPVNYL